MHCHFLFREELGVFRLVLGRRLAINNIADNLVVSILAF